MRLICPNCDAQYDISDDAIPHGGRDVQCSSCAHTWFQTEKPVMAGRSSANLVASAIASARQDPRPEAADTPKHKPLDHSIGAILREELAHEKKARATTAPPTTQAEAPPATVDPEETLRRISRLTKIEGGFPTAAPAPAPSNGADAAVASASEADAAAASGADAAAKNGAVAAADPNIRAVPSIDEINASLRARAEASDSSGLTEAEQQDVSNRRGFRRGFFFVLILLAILILPYIFQAQINDNLPQLQPYMASYVETVDQLRLILNEQAQRLKASLEGITAGAEAS